MEWSKIEIGAIAAQDYGLILNELVKNGEKYINIEEHQNLLDMFIEINWLLERSNERYDEIVKALKLKLSK